MKVIKKKKRGQNFGNKRVWNIDGANEDDDYSLGQFWTIMQVIALFILIAVNLHPMNITFIVTVLVFAAMTRGSISALKDWRSSKKAAGLSWENNVEIEHFRWMGIALAAIFAASLGISLVTAKVFGWELSLQSLRVFFLYDVGMLTHIPVTMTQAELDVLWLGWWPARPLALLMLPLFSWMETAFYQFLYHFFLVAFAEESMRFAFQVILYDVLDERYGEDVATYFGFGFPIVFWATLHLILSYISGNVFGNWLAAVIAGIILFGLIRKTKSLKSAVIVHGSFNWLLSVF
jgi:hypothetical protein